MWFALFFLPDCKGVYGRGLIGNIAGIFPVSEVKQPVGESGEIGGDKQGGGSGKGGDWAVGPRMGDKPGRKRRKGGNKEGLVGREGGGREEGREGGKEGVARPRMGRIGDGKRMEGEQGHGRGPEVRCLSGFPNTFPK